MGTLERRQREAAQRRKAILNAARSLFWEHGYTKTTMPQIAQSIELAPGTLYLYFSSKDSLYVELLIEGYELLIDRLREQVRPEAAPAQQASALVDAFVDFAHAHPEYFDIMFFVLQGEGGNAESTLEADQVRRLKAHEQTCKDYATRILEQAQPSQPPRERELMVEAIWSMLAGVIFYFRKDKDFRPVASQAKALLLKAIFGPAIPSPHSEVSAH